MAMLNGTLSLWDVDDTERFCRSIANAFLRRKRASLSHEDLEDLVSYLITEAWELSQRYDPAKSSSFSKYAYGVLPNKVSSWYRSRFAPRDQTSEGWYKRLYPTSKPVDADHRRGFFFPESLNTERHEHHAVEPDGGQDPVVTAVRARSADPLLDCDPALHDVIARTVAAGNRLHPVPAETDDRRAPAGDRKAA